MNSVAQLPLFINLIAFAVLASAIWFAGTRLSHLSKAIGKATGIGPAMMGLLFLGGITELPELVTTGTAAIKGNAALALNNMLGGIPMQTAILAVADILVVHVALTSTPKKHTPLFEGAILAFLLLVLFALISVGEIAIVTGLGVGALILASLYVVFIYALNRYEKNHGLQFEAVDEGVVSPDSLRTLIWKSSGAGAIILVCGVLLVNVCEAIAVQTSLGNSFVGVTLLAITTSLPELSTTIAAVRMGAFTMAISNIFGSNLLMIFILLPADMLYREGEILAQVDDISKIALLSGIVMTLIYVFGLVMKHKPRILGMGVDSALVMAIYMASLYAFYVVR